MLFGLYPRNIYTRPLGIGIVYGNLREIQSFVAMTRLFLAKRSTEQTEIKLFNWSQNTFLAV